MSSMESTHGLPILYMIACAAPPTQDMPLVIPQVRAAGWDVYPILTPSARPFVDLGAIERAAGRPARIEYRRPEEPRLPPPNRVLVAPLTYNTLNKWAVGIADTFALGVIAEAIGDGVPMVAVPWAKGALRANPPFARSLAALRDCGVHVIDQQAVRSFDPQQQIPAFPWSAALEALSFNLHQPDPPDLSL